MQATTVLGSLSLARTALDEPTSLPADAPSAAGYVGHDLCRYAVDRIDDAIRSLDAELEPAVALRTIGQLLEEVHEELDDYGVGGDGEPFDTRAEAARLRHAIDLIDGVRDALVA
jgi:hypothetical protein